MTTRPCDGSFQAAVAAMLLCATSTLVSPAHAQVNSSGLGTVVTPSRSNYDITGGTRPGGGANLFHSFGDFGLNAGESANFLNTPAAPVTANILARVTAGNPSNIFGTINTLDFGGAHLFLMNPAGIVFGPTARLDVGGSFHATTADYIKLSDGAKFAIDSPADVLTTAAPAAFGFLSASPKPIEVQTGSVGFDPDTFELLVGTLKVPDGQTLSLVGGNAPGSPNPGVSIGALDGSAPGYVLAPAGRVNLVSVAAAGEAMFDGTGFTVDGFASLGGVRVGAGSVVDGKEIFIRGGQLAIHDGVVMPSAFAIEQTFAVDPVTRLPLTGLPNGGQVNIKVTGDVTISGSPGFFETVTFKPAGILVYSGNPFFISDAARLPDITIEAGSLSVTGFSAIQAQRNAPGEAGNVTITADKVSVGSGGAIVLLNTYSGDGPSLTIAAKEVDVSGDGNSSVYGVEGLFVQGLKHVTYPATFTDPEFITANSGNISIEATDSLAVRGLGQITTDSLNFGKAGDVTIKAGNVLVAGTGDPQSALVGSQSNFAGDAGNITVSATGSITVQNGGRITSASFGSGNAGAITLTAAGPITLSGQDARIVGATFPPPDSQLNDLFASIYGGQPIFDADFNVIGFTPFDFNYFRNLMGNPSASLMQVLAYMQSTPIELPNTTPGPVVLLPIPDLSTTPGNAGTVSVKTPQLTVNSGTRIETSTGWEGQAGSVIADVGALLVLDGGALRSRSGVEFLDGTIGVGTGSAGSVTITASDTIIVSGAGSAISTSTFGAGLGGNVTLSAGNQVSVLDGGRAVGESGGILGGAVTVGSGSSGGVSISAGNLINVSGAGSKVSTTTFGDGPGGNVNLSAGQVTVQGGGKVASESGGLLGDVVAVGAGTTGIGGTVTISATGGIAVAGGGSVVSTSTFGNAGGGNVNMEGGSFVQILDGGRVTADSGGTLGTSVVSGTGIAGDIKITAGSDIYLNNGKITTQGLTADGGNITLEAPNMVRLQDSETSTSVAGGEGKGGNIRIDPQFVVLNNATVIANAFGGPGGNITIIANNFLQSATSVIAASSALSTPGTIAIQSPENNVESSIAQLPGAFVDASSLLRSLCTARRTGAPSSFVVAGRGGVPVDPDGYLPSFGADAAVALASTDGALLPDADRLSGRRLVFRLAAMEGLDCSR